MTEPRRVCTEIAPVDSLPSPGPGSVRGDWSAARRGAARRVYAKS